MNSRWRDERGSAAVEAVIGVPVFVLLILLAIMGGRVALAKQAVDAATADAARVASLSRDATKAKSDAIEVAEASLANQGITCLDTATRLATDWGDTTLTGIHVTGQRTTTRVTITVQATAVSLLPGTSWPVEQSATLPVERLR